MKKRKKFSFLLSLRATPSTVEELRGNPMTKQTRLLQLTLASLRVACLWGVFFSSTTFAATLNVSQIAHSGVIPRNGVRVPFLTITATAIDGPVHITGFVIRRNGLSSDSDIDRIYARTNDAKKSFDASFNDGVAALSFITPLNIGDSWSSRITFYANMDMQFPSGRSVFFTLEKLHSDADWINFVPVDSHPKVASVPLLERKKPTFRIVCESRVCRKMER